MVKIRKQRKGKMKGKEKKEGRRKRMKEIETVGGESSETHRG